MKIAALLLATAALTATVQHADALSVAQRQLLFSKPKAAAVSSSWTLTTAGDTGQTNFGGHDISLTGLSIPAGHVVCVLAGAIAAVNGDASVMVPDGASNTLAVAVHQVYVDPSSTHTVATACGKLVNTMTRIDWYEGTQGGAAVWGSGGLTVIDISAGFTSGTLEDAAVFASNVNNSGSTTPTVTSGTPTQAGDLFLSAYSSDGNIFTLTYTEDAAWTNRTINTPPDYGWSSQVGSGATKVNNTAGTLQHNPTLSNAQNYAQIIIGLKPAP